MPRELSLGCCTENLLRRFEKTQDWAEFEEDTSGKDTKKCEAEKESKEGCLEKVGILKKVRSRA